MFRDKFLVLNENINYIATDNDFLSTQTKISTNNFIDKFTKASVMMDAGLFFELIEINKDDIEFVEKDGSIYKYSLNIDSSTISESINSNIEFNFYFDNSGSSIKRMELMFKAEEEDTKVIMESFEEIGEVPQIQSEMIIEMKKISELTALSIGSTDASLEIVESTAIDPFSLRFFNDTYTQIKNDYVDAGRVRMTIRPINLRFIQNSKRDFLIIMCGFKQGKGKEVYESVFLQMNVYEEINYAEIAANKTINLLIDDFITCIESEKYSELMKVWLRNPPKKVHPAVLIL